MESEVTDLAVQLANEIYYNTHECLGDCYVTDMKIFRSKYKISSIYSEGYSASRLCDNDLFMKAKKII